VADETRPRAHTIVKSGGGMSRETIDQILHWITFLWALVTIVLLTATSLNIRS
jgi:hypothetical protein